MIRKPLNPKPPLAVNEQLVRKTGEAAVATDKKRGGVITYVLARNTSAFIIWLRGSGSGSGSGSGRNLQTCKFLETVEMMQGLDFSAPERELLVINGWETGKNEEELEAGHRIIARYCLQKRVHSVPTDV